MLQWHKEAWVKCWYPRFPAPLIQLHRCGAGKQDGASAWGYLHVEALWNGGPQVRGRRVFSGYHCALGKEEQVLLYDHQKSSSTLLAWLPALTGKQCWLL